MRQTVKPVGVSSILAVLVRWQLMQVKLIPQLAGRCFVAGEYTILPSVERFIVWQYTQGRLIDGAFFMVQPFRLRKSGRAFLLVRSQYRTYSTKGQATGRKKLDNLTVRLLGLIVASPGLALLY